MPLGFLCSRRSIVRTFFFLSFMCANVYAQQESQTTDNLVRIQEALKPAMQDFIQAIFQLKPFKSKYTPILREAEWKELECDLMVQKLDRTQTVFGFWGLRALSHPISHAQELARRQMLIKKLVTDEGFRKTIETILDDIKATENEVIAYWNINDLLNAQSRSLYYSLFGSWSQSLDGHLNRNRIALEGASLFSMAKSITALAAGLGGVGVFNEAVAAITENREPSMLNGLFNGFSEPLRINNPFPHVCKDGFARDKLSKVLTHGSGGDRYILFNHSAPAVLAGVAAIALTGFEDYSYHMRIHSLIDQWKFLFNTTNLVQVRMAHVATFFKALERLQDLVASHEAIFGSDIKDALDANNRSATMQQLIALLKTSTFDQPSNSFYSRGKVLLAHQLMNDARDQLIPLLQLVAQIDGYHSIATLFKDQNTEQAPFCFVEFVPSNVPHLQCQECWTPLVPTGKPVLNSFDWHKNTHHKIVLTGPNGSGKSTVMKAISHAIILGQAWGVCPARHAVMRVFTGLRSSLSPREDLQQNLSTFMAEKRRIDDIKEFVLNFGPDDCFFVLLDEPYRGTVESEAEYRIDLLAQELVPFNHCMMIMATHLEKPTTLPERTNGIFANYQLGLEEKADGTFIRTFTVLPGFAQWWFKDMFKRRRFIDQLLQGH